MGSVTSVCTLEGETFALGYLQSRVDSEAQAWEGRQVRVGDTVAKVRSTSGHHPPPAAHVCAMMACTACLDQAEDPNASTQTLWVSHDVRCRVLMAKRRWYACRFNCHPRRWPRELSACSVAACGLPAGCTCALGAVVEGGTPAGGVCQLLAVSQHVQRCQEALGEGVKYRRAPRLAVRELRDLNGRELWNET